MWWCRDAEVVVEGFCEEDEAAAACAWDVLCFVPCWEGRAEGGEARKAAKKVERKKGRWEDMLCGGIGGREVRYGRFRLLRLVGGYRCCLEVSSRYRGQLCRLFGLSTSEDEVVMMSDSRFNGLVAVKDVVDVDSTKMMKMAKRSKSQKATSVWCVRLFPLGTT